jgi:hypothetical protein
VDKAVDSSMDKFGDSEWINCGKVPLRAKIGYWIKVIQLLSSVYTKVFHRFF